MDEGRENPKSDVYELIGLEARPLGSYSSLPGYSYSYSTLYY